MKLRTDAVQADKTPLYMISFDDGPDFYLIDGVSYDLLKHSLG